MLSFYLVDLYMYIFQDNKILSINKIMLRLKYGVLCRYFIDEYLFIKVMFKN